MNELEDIKSRFSGKLDTRISQPEQRTQAELADLQAKLMREFKANLPPDMEQRSQRLMQDWPAASLGKYLMVDISSTDPLREMDEAFISVFNLADWYPPEQMRSPTKYCETLDDFIRPGLEMFNFSPEHRERIIQEKILQYEQKKGLKGVYLSGKGVFINGWEFTRGQKITPRQAFEQPGELQEEILRTVAHEKYGHGFLSDYSTLGEISNRLGLKRQAIAHKFDLQITDDITSSLRAQQEQIILHVSLILEEGWATWIGDSLKSLKTTSASHPHFNPKDVLLGLEKASLRIPQLQEILNNIKFAFICLFDWEMDFSNTQGFDRLLFDAIHILENIPQKVDDFLYHNFLGMPIRYVIGELLLTQAEQNLGTTCLPFAALIAANVTFDFEKIGLADLEILLSSDPNLNPDYRLAALSRMQLEEKGDVIAMARQAYSNFSFSIPQELK